MTQISVTLPADGETIDASDVNNPFIAIIAVLNGGITADNITAGSMPWSIMDPNMTNQIPQKAIVDTGGWTVSPYTFSSVTYNGQRSYTAVISGQDMTGKISPGMRIGTTRSVQAPIQCTNLNGTTQYFSKASPAGMTFTDDFTVAAWVKLPAASTGYTVASRVNITTGNGWLLDVRSDGTARLSIFNGGTANFSNVTTIQAVPVGRWVHITAQLDASSFTASPTTSYIMFDGVDIPATVARGGTNPTSFTQTGNFDIGARSSVTTPDTFFTGKIAQVALFNAKVTQATMRGYISQGLVGNEASLISAFSLSNSLNDLNTTNANNLTATGSATTTTADSPFGGQASGLISSTLDYGIVMSSTFSTDTTLVIQVPAVCTIPTSGGVTSMKYAPNGTPYGFPSAKSEWSILAVFMTDSPNVSMASVNTWYVSSVGKLTVPQGKFVPGYEMTVLQSSTASGTRSMTVTMSTTAPTNGVLNGEFNSRIREEGVPLTIATVSRASRVPTDHAPNTVYSMYASIAVSSGTEAWNINASSAGSVMYVENAYL